MKKVLCFILILMLLLVGCVKENDTVESYVKIIPSKLFEGDAKKLAPHFDMTTGCVKVEYQGDKESLCVKYEIWEKGEIKKSQDAISRHIDENKFDGEVSISLKDIIGTDLKKANSMVMKMIISEDNGYCGSTKYVDRFSEKCGYGPVEIYEQINASDREELIVWGFTAHEGSFSSSGDNIEEEVKTADWGLILKIYFK